MYVRIPDSHKDLILEFLVREMPRDLAPALDEGPLDGFPTLPKSLVSTASSSSFSLLVKFKTEV